MAIWQFNIEFFPINGLTAELGNIPVKIPDNYLPDFVDYHTHLDDYTDPRTNFWKNHYRDDFSGLIHELTYKLPEVEWLISSTDVFSWGHENTNDLTLSFKDDNQVESFGCRIDLREIDESFIDLILELCNRNKYLISDRQGNLRTANRLELGKLIANSNPANFVADPEKFLNDFENGKRKPK
ncbi:MAG: hypothetical protein ABJO02_02745 [Reichenbachiella sp.]|uniref:hypothetical protein n=1 Tax=Reichenbachiella sp. TaxID=2184521 RepID=UPI0032969FF6